VDDRSKARALVLGQFGTIAAWLWQGPLLAPHAAGVAVQIAGVALGAWAAIWMSLRQRRAFSVTPLPDAHPRLVVDGPYRWVRHPMYTAVLAVALPAALAGPGGSVVAGLALTLVLVAKHRLEDRLLAARFPEHADYRRRTGGLLPFVG
jgi:protein-S-isoprenylcysteine O-methyltransferase Ste14